MAGPAVDVKRLETLYEERHIPRLIVGMGEELEWGDFESFVAYAFKRAGYGVKETGLQFGPGIDLKLYQSEELRGKPIACVSVKHHKVGSALVTAPQVKEFYTSLLDLGCPVGYLVTNTDFTGPAYAEAEGLPKLHLVNGKLLARYIAYVRGSRLARSSGPIISPDWLIQADGIPLRVATQTVVLAVANNKGGVGKTTTALYLAKRLAEQSKRVLLVDFDSQMNSTHSLPYPHTLEGTPPHLVDYFEGDKQLNELIRPTQLQRVYLVPGHKDLRLANTHVAGGPESELRFVRDLHAPMIRPPQFVENGGFDWVIIDTPPEMTLRTRAAIAASHYVLAPIEPGPYADSGLMQLLDTADAMRGLMGGGAQILGCVITKWQDVGAQRDAVYQLKQLVLDPNRIRLFDTRIPFDANVIRDEQNVFRVPGLSKKPAAVRYTELAEEVIKYANHG